MSDQGECSVEHLKIWHLQHSLITLHVNRMNIKKNEAIILTDLSVKCVCILFLFMNF